MASAEARARWLRNANHCFIDEDYKGVSRTHSSPSSSSKSDYEGSPSNLLPDTKWWLHRQTTSGDHYVCSLGHVDILETEVGVSRAESVNRTATQIYGARTYAKSTAGSLWDSSWEALSACMENEGIPIEELEAVISDTFQKKPMNDDMGDFGLADEKPSKLSSELESHWIGVEKTEPWWRTSDIDELASFVSHKSLEHFENCDLPGPQKKHSQSFDHDKGLASLGQKAEKEISNFADSMLKTPSSVSMDKEQSALGAVECSPHVSDMSSSGSNGCSTTKTSEVEKLHAPNNSLSKAQLLEALCHSQTRAREAEKAAQQAYDEKEHIIQLFFRQASQLFAYKQWLQILQLESLCLQLRYNKNQPIYTRFPDFLPWVATKGSQPRKGQRKAPNRKSGPTRYGNCAAAFIMGLSLAGAGLLLGWTMGWLFPAR